MPGCLALDLGARNLGWACDGRGNQPRHGLVLLPGTAHLGKLYAATRNAFERLLTDHEPERVCYVPKFATRGKTAVRTAEALGGVQATVDLVAYDCGLPEPVRINERTARKAVLGRCDFGLRDAHGRMIADSGREEAKRTVLEWCARQGFEVLSHDVGDSLVLLHFDQMQRRGRHGPKPGLALR